MNFKGTNYKTMEEWLIANGCNPEELLQMKYHAYDFAKGYQFVMQAIKEAGLIYIIGDYDVDGIASTTELDLIIKTLGGYSVRRIPKRISEGYGLSPTIVAEIPDNAYLITVDNGITAHGAINLAKARNIKVMIMDHHLPDTDRNNNPILPNADVIYNPHIDHSEYKQYCAAGVVYKFAEYLFGNHPTTLMCNILAAIATIADMVELKGDNRNIVKSGLYLINSKSIYIPIALKALLDESSLSRISEQDISFKLAPIINAKGRLEDTGSQFVCDFFAEEDYQKACKMANDLILANMERQKMATEFTNQTEELLTNTDITKPICLYLKGIPEGIIGLIAGNVAERYKVPAFVMTDTPSGDLKGSARNAKRMHIKNFLDKNTNLLLKAGGHRGAGGFSLLSSNFEQFYNNVVNEPIEIIEDNDYDIDIKQSDMALWFHNLSKYEPYGIDVPAPIFHIGCFEAYPRYNKFADAIGSDKQHLRVYGSGCDCIGFNLYSKYESYNKPKRLELIGTLGCNYHNGKEQIQFRIRKMAKYERKEEKSKEALFLAELAERKQNHGQ